jgi:hypothetical protein
MWADCYFVAITNAQQQSSNGCSVLAKETLKRKHKSECQKQLALPDTFPSSLALNYYYGAHNNIMDHFRFYIILLPISWITSDFT